MIKASRAIWLLHESSPDNEGSSSSSKDGEQTANGERLELNDLFALSDADATATIARVRYSFHRASLLLGSDPT